MLLAISWTKTELKGLAELALDVLLSKKSLQYILCSLGWNINI